MASDSLSPPHCCDFCQKPVLGFEEQNQDISFVGKPGSRVSRSGWYDALGHGNTTIKPNLVMFDFAVAEKMQFATRYGCLLCPQIIKNSWDFAGCEEDNAIIAARVVLILSLLRSALRRYVLETLVSAARWKSSLSTTTAISKLLLPRVSVIWRLNNIIVVAKAFGAKDDPAAREIDIPDIHLNPPSDSGLALAWKWFDTCHTTHKHCIKHSSDYWPTRLIKIDYSRGLTYLRLCETTNEHHAHYSALSYCWDHD